MKHIMGSDLHAIRVDSKQRSNALHIVRRVRACALCVKRIKCRRNYGSSSNW